MTQNTNKNREYDNLDWTFSQLIQFAHSGLPRRLVGSAMPTGTSWRSARTFCLWGLKPARKISSGAHRNTWSKKMAVTPESEGLTLHVVLMAEVVESSR
jgi:hypothetical protein